MDKNFKAVNAPIIDFEPGSKHREELIKEIERQSNRQKEVPVIIHGKVEGDIRATDKIELLHTASVLGDLYAAILKVDPGAKLSGRSTIGSVAKSGANTEDAYLALFDQGVGAHQ